MVGKKDFPKEKTSVLRRRKCFLDSFGSGELIAFVPVAILIELVAVEVPLGVIEIAVHRDDMYCAPSVSPPLDQPADGLSRLNIMRENITLPERSTNFRA